MTDADLFDPQSPLFGAVDGAVATLYLNRPEKHNAFTTALWQRFVVVLAALEASDARVIIIRARSGASFCAGADIAELSTMIDDPARAEANRHALRQAQARLAAAIKPTLAVIGGPCYGAGCGLAIHADFRLASDRATFGITPAKLGLVYPLPDTARLVDLIGPARAKLMLYGAQTLNSATALTYGLVDRVVDGADLAPAAATLADEIAALSPSAILAMKQQFARIEAGQRGDDDWSRTLFVERHLSVDMREGVNAFLGKRKADFPDMHD